MALRCWIENREPFLFLYRIQFSLYEFSALWAFVYFVLKYQNVFTFFVCWAASALSGFRWGNHQWPCIRSMRICLQCALCGACLNTLSSYTVTFYEQDFYDFLLPLNCLTWKFCLAHFHSLRSQCRHSLSNGRQCRYKWLVSNKLCLPLKLPWKRVLEWAIKQPIIAKCKYWVSFVDAKLVTLPMLSGATSSLWNWSINKDEGHSKGKETMVCLSV